MSEAKTSQELDASLGERFAEAYRLENEITQRDVEYEYMRALGAILGKEIKDHLLGIFDFVHAAPEQRLRAARSALNTIK
jgi:hypothetical protein